MPVVSNFNIDNQQEVSFVPNDTPSVPMDTAMPTPSIPELTDSMTPYASFGKRFLAFLIDALLLGFCVSFLSTIFGFSAQNMEGGISPFNVLGLIYFVFMTSKYGATLGKMAMHIKVKDATPGQELSLGMIILRESVGKMVSFFVFGLGCLWMLWDSKKQTWHDKIANSIVVEN